jgi:hypothetical protein
MESTIMASTGNSLPTSQWWWDRSNAREVPSMAWAGQNCVGKDSTELSTQKAMQQKVLQEWKSAELIITSELHQLLRDVASIAGMSYLCKLTQHTLACTNSKDVHLSWVQDGRRYSQVGKVISYPWRVGGT